MRKQILAFLMVLGLAFASTARADTFTAIARRDEGARQQQTGTTLLYLAAANLILAAVALPIWLDPGSGNEGSDAGVVRQSTGMYLFTGAAITGSMFFSIGLPLYLHGRHLATPAPVTLSVGNPTGITLHF